MFLQKIHISFNTQADKEKILDLFNTLLGSLRQGGQIYEKVFPILKETKGLSAVVLTSEKTSLSKENASKYSLKSIENLEDYCKNRIETSVIGEDIESEDIICDCEEHSFFILYTSYIKVGSPLHCGECFGQVPLYR